MPDDIPAEIRDLKKRRSLYRKQGKYKKADLIRKRIEKHGYLVTDTEEKSILIPLRTEKAGIPDINGKGLLAVFGSGEISSSGRKVHEYLIRSFHVPVKIALLETPAGYEDNPHHWYLKLEKFLLSG